MHLDTHTHPAGGGIYRQHPTNMSGGCGVCSSWKVNRVVSYPSMHLDTHTHRILCKKIGVSLCVPPLHRGPEELTVQVRPRGMNKQAKGRVLLAGKNAAAISKKRDRSC
jgi:hypothetical protein